MSFLSKRILNLGYSNLLFQVYKKVVFAFFLSPCIMLYEHMEKKQGHIQYSLDCHKKMENTQRAWMLYIIVLSLNCVTTEEGARATK